MSKVTIVLEGDETHDEVEDNLLKALTSKVSGDIHAKEKFDDPALQHVAQTMERLHREIYQEMIEEIQEALVKEHSG